MFIFISYSHLDNSVSRDLELMLKNNSIEYFLYDRHIPIGEPIVDNVMQAIKKSTHMLVVMSESSRNSSWVGYEVGVATGVSIATGRSIVVIPFLAEKKCILPDFLRGVRYIQSIHELDEFIKQEKQKREVGEHFESMATGGQFDFYGFRTTIKMIEFCAQGYKHENVNLRLVGHNKRKPSTELKKHYTFFKTNWNEKAIKGAIYDHGDLVGLGRYTLRRVGKDENQALDLEVFVGSYVDHRAIVDVFRSLSSHDKCTEIQKAVDSGGLQGGHSFFGNIIAVSLALITSDQKMVFQRRSKDVSIDPDLIMCGVGEGMKLSDLDNVRGLFSGPYQTAIRGLEEEFGIKLDHPNECITLNGLCLNRELFEWYFLGIINLQKANYVWDEKAVRAYFSTSYGKDRFEISDLFFVPYNPRSIFSFLREHRDEMVNYGIVSSICSMLSDPQFQLNDLRDTALSVLAQKIPLT